jgi:hypothetical protein
LSNLISSNVEINLDDSEKEKTVNPEEKLFRFEDDFMFENAGCNQMDLRFGILDLPKGPEPGPQMPKKRRPKIV